MTDDLRDAGDVRDEFVEQQQSGIGATDGPKILGLSRWGSALTVWDRLTNGPKDRAPSLPAWLGLKLESTVAELFTTATGLRVRAANKHYRHPEYDWIVCHLDYRVVGAKALLECKTRAHMKGYGPDGSAEVPADVWVQVQHEMAVTGAEVCYVAVLFGHHTFRVYPIPRDDEFLKRYLLRLKDFYENYVLTHQPPPVSGNPMDADYLASEFPDHDATLKAATPEHEKLVGKLRAARTNVAQAEAAKAEAENQIKQVIGEAAGLVGAFGKITWKRTKDRETIDWQRVATQYASIVERLMGILDEGLPEEDGTGTTLPLAREQLESELKIDRAVYATAVGLATTTTLGSRRFLADLTEE